MWNALCCVSATGLTMGRETKARWGGGLVLGPSAKVSRVGGAYILLEGEVEKSGAPAPVELEVKRQGRVCPQGLTGVRFQPRSPPSVLAEWAQWPSTHPSGTGAFTRRM